MRLVLLLIAIMMSAINSYANENLDRYTSELEKYNFRCQRGDYIGFKPEELRDVGRINLIGRKLGKADFLAQCQTVREVRELHQPRNYSDKSNPPVSKSDINGETIGTKKTRPLHQPTVYSDISKYPSSQGGSASINDSNQNETVKSAGGIEMLCPTNEDVQRFMRLRNSKIPVPFLNLNSPLNLQSCHSISGVKNNTLVMIFFGNGDAYWGPIIDNKYQGVAEYIFSRDRKTYLGEFKDGVFNGVGTIYNNDSGEIVAQNVFRNGEIASSTPDSQPELSKQSDSAFASKCATYGFQRGSDGFANCIMQMENAQAQANLQFEQRQQLEQQCGLAKAQGWLAPTRTGGFAESAQNAEAAYSRCMAGLPPPHNYTIDCKRNGNNFNCYAY